MVLDQIQNVNDIKNLTEEEIDTLQDLYLSCRIDCENRWSPGIESWCDRTYDGTSFVV